MCALADAVGLPHREIDIVGHARRYPICKTQIRQYAGPDAPDRRPRGKRHKWNACPDCIKEHATAGMWKRVQDPLSREVFVKQDSQGILLEISEVEHQTRVWNRLH